MHPSLGFFHPSEPWRQHPYIRAPASSKRPNHGFFHQPEPWRLPSVLALAPSIGPSHGVIIHTFEPWLLPSARASASPAEPWRHHPHIRAMASSTRSSDLFRLSYVSSDRGVIIHSSKPGSLPFVHAMAPYIHPTLGFLHHEPWRQPSALAFASSIQVRALVSSSVRPSNGVIHTSKS